MLIASVFIYLLNAIVCCKAFFQKYSLANLLFAFYIVVYAFNILISEALSLLGVLNSAPLFFALQTVLAALTIFLVMKRWKLTWKDLLPKKSSEASKKDVLSIVLTVLAALPMLVLLLVGLQTAPNNSDTLHTHLPRIYYWLQHGSLAFWSATGLAQLVYPINANLQGLWLFLFSHNSYLFFLVSWFSLLIILVSVYQIARLLRFNRHQALISCLVTLTIPTALLQVYSFQIDLAVTAAIAVTISLLLSYFETHQLSELILSILMMSIAIGIKQTAFFVLPAIAFWVLYRIITRKFEKKHLPYLSLIVAFFLVFSSYQYIQNLMNFHSFFGVSDVFYGQNMSSSSLLGKLEYDAPRYIYNSLSVDGLDPKLARALTSVKEAIFKTVLSPVHLDLEKEVFLPTGYDPSERFKYATVEPLTEETTWFGPLSITLAVLAFFLVIFQKDKSRKEYAVFALILYGSYFMELLIQRPGWDPYQGRYFVTAFIPMLPLLAVVVPQKKTVKTVEVSLISLIFVFLAFNITFLNDSKPIITASTMINWQNKYVLNAPMNTKVEKIWKTYAVKVSDYLATNLLQRQSILSLSYYDQMFFSASYSQPMFEMIDASVPAGQPLYLMMSSSVIEYSLFGFDRSRALYPITDITEVPQGGYLLLENSHAVNLDDFLLINKDNVYSVFLREK